MFRPDLWLRALMLVVVFSVPVTAMAAPRLSISSPSGDGSTFVLRGERMDGVSGLDIRVGYDGATLRNPRVTMGSLVSGMMSAANPANPIRVALVGTRPLSGSGIIATITFDRTGSAPGAITSLTASAIDNSSPPKAIPMAASGISNPVATAAADDTKSDTTSANQTGSGTAGSDTQTDVSQGGTTTTSGSETTATGSGRQFVGGTLTFPDQVEQPSDRKEPAAKQAQAENPEHQLEREGAAPLPSDERQPAETKAPQQTVTPPRQMVSVLERFRRFEGERTVERLTALFRQERDTHITQSPAIGIVDGKATVTLAIDMATGERAPNFAFTAARYVSLHRTAQGWELEVRPDKGAIKAGVTMLYEGQVQEIPLTVAPKADLVPGKPRPVSEGDFKLFLKERGTPTAPAYDLNNDRRRDFLDDYIFTANYLVRMEEQAAKRKESR